MSRTVQFNVEGMSCGSCVRHVTSALRGVAGVREVSVDLAGKGATVVVDDTVSAEALRAAVVEAGYEASVRAGE